MKLLATFVLILSSAIAQAPADDENNQTAQNQPPTASAQATQNEAQRSALGVEPGPEVIKPKDLYDATGYLHPFVRMPKYVLHDQAAIWTSPFHTSKKDAIWWAVFGGATAALIASDKSTVKWLPNSSSQISVSNWGSRIGSAYTLVPLTAGFYFIGTAEHSDRFRETGLLGFETLLDVNLVAEAMKLVADRARPLEGNGKGDFESSPSRWSSGFPSGHAINTWALASIVAHQYPHPRYVPVIAYLLASTVVISRVGARQHFPGDVLAGSAMGWFIGDYVYGKRHNPALDQKPTAAQRILNHVQIGASLN